MVFACHLVTLARVDLGRLSSIAENGRTGVVLFFGLSGYLLYRPFLQVARESRRADLRGYFIRRLLRIYPAYLLALVGASILLGDDTFVRQPLTYVFFLQNFDGHLFAGFLGSSWTLVLEMTFYLTLPLLAAGLMRLSPRRHLTALVAIFDVSLVSSLGVYLATTGGRPYSLESSLFPFVLWAFVPGMLLAAVEVDRPAWLRAFGRKSLLVGVALIATGLWIGVWATIDAITALGGFLVLAYLVARPPSGRSVRLLAAAGCWLSYPFYLWHEQVILALRDSSLPGPLLAFGVLLGTGAIAAASYVVVERPALDLARRLTPRRQRAVLPSPAVEAVPTS